MIYADNAATTRTGQPARQAMLDAMDRFWGNPSSLHTPGQQAAEALQAAREAVAKAINAQPREIYFTSGGSEADNHAIVSAARLGAKRAKSTSSPPPSSTTPSFTPWNSFPKRASRSPSSRWTQAAS